MSNHGLIRLKKSSRKLVAIYVISYFFSLYLILHACVQTSDGTWTKIRSKEPNRPLLLVFLVIGDEECNHSTKFEEWAMMHHQLELVDFSNQTLCYILHEYSFGLVPRAVTFCDWALNEIGNGNSLYSRCRVRETN